MKKLFWTLSAALAAFSLTGGAFASARLDSMAADPRQVGDIDLIWLYPNMVTDYKNTVDFRLFPYAGTGDGTNEWGGALLEVDPDFGVLGVYVNRPTWEDSSYSQVWNNRAVLTPSHYDQGRVGNAPWWMFPESYSNQVDLFWGKSTGSNTSFGVHFNYGSGGTDTSVYSLDLGLGLGDVGPFGDLNVHGGYAMENFDFGGGGKSNGIYTAKLGAISTSGLTTGYDLRSFVDLQMDGYKAENNGNNSFGGPEDYSDWTLDLGTGVNHKIADGKGLLSTGLKFEYIGASSPSSEADFNIDEWSLLWNASLEAPVADWLTVRTGLTKAIVIRQYDRNDIYGHGVYYDNSQDPVQFSTGFGINWQNFTLNASVDAASLENTINNVQPGKGLFFNNGNIVTVETADLTYKF